MLSSNIKPRLPEKIFFLSRFHSAGLWTVFTLGGVGSKRAPQQDESSPLANQSLLLLLVLANLTDASDTPNPYRQAIMSFKNTQGLYLSKIICLQRIEARTHFCIVFWIE